MFEWLLLILFLGTAGGIIGGLCMLFYEDPCNFSYNSNPGDKEDRINSWGFVVELIGLVFLIALATYLEHAPTILELLGVVREV